MPNKFGQRQYFVSATLPWLVAGAALIVYLLTFNSWISLDNVNEVAAASGWIPQDQIYSPVFFTVTFPFHWLPAQWVPLAYNLFSVICAVLTFALLARSIALLPHDRTREERMRERSEFSLLTIGPAWIPPVLATIVCGLQLTFWEDATGGAPGMFDVLLMAYVIRCLLEYRIGERESWLFRAAFVCGAGMANGWLMFCLFPAYIISLVWIKGFGFFNFRFFSRMLFLGAAGMLFYLLLPLIHLFSADSTVTFWQALKANLTSEKSVLIFFVSQLPKTMLLLLIVTSLLPLILIGIRWPSNFGDTSRSGGALATWVLHVAHASLLGVCIWVAFDPAFSPRHEGFPFPAFSYLAALSVGYFSGYFLLVFRPLQTRTWRRSPLDKWLNPFSQAIVWALLLLVPAGLLFKNLPLLSVTNGHAIQEYASLLTQKIPERAVVLSDDSRKLVIAQAWATRVGKAKDYLFLDTAALQEPAYHRLQQKIHPDWWPPITYPKRDEYGPFLLMNLLLKFAETHPIYYLHPSYGYYFEKFCPQPRGLAFELTLCPTNSFSASALNEVQITENQKFWQENEATMEILHPFVSPPEPDLSVNFRRWLFTKMHIPFEANATAVMLAQFYSEGLNTWGVYMQRASKLPEAERLFARALELNPDNAPAKVNLAYNKDLQAGRQARTLKPPPPPENELGKYKSWGDALRDNGPLDEPSHVVGEAIVFAQNGLVRQGTARLERIHTLMPDDLLTRFWLARVYLADQFPEKALDEVAVLRTNPNALENVGIRSLDIFQTEAMALFAAGRDAQAEQVLHRIVEKDPKNPNALAAAVQVCTMFGRYTNALPYVEQQLKLQPDNHLALVIKGFLCMQLGNYDEAIPPLTRALDLASSNHVARLDRAIAYLNSGRLNEAENDYKTLQNALTNSFQVYYGLGEIAWRKKETNSAIRYYELYLSNAAPATAEAKLVSERLQGLKSGSH